ncbi:MAG: 4Fe-4S binding protein [Planctomycetota bacterium]|nr:4Fe-4S binding protein [Planctomycetota bacterium]
MKLPKRQITLIRRTAQVSLFILIIYATTLGIPQVEVPFLPFNQPPAFLGETYRGGFPSPPYNQVFDAYMPSMICRFNRPTGMFRSCFYHFLTEMSPWYTPLRDILPHLLLFLILVILLGRFWCGWICPLGFIQDVLTIIRKYLGLAYFRVSETINQLLKKTGYVILISAIGISIMITFPCFLPLWLRKSFFLAGCQMCPARVICPILSGYPLPLTFLSPVMTILFVIALIFLVIFLLSAVVKRAWCRVCPSGIIISWFNRGSLLTMEKDVSKCTRCGACAVGCPVQSNYVYEENNQKVVNHSECISCYRCVDLCPEEKCLQVKLPGMCLFKSKSD